MTTDIERAITIIREGRYLTLATTEDDRPWATPLAYSAHGDGHLYFYTGVDTAHYRHFSRSGLVAGAIFDSRLPNIDADGVQFEGLVRDVHEPDLEHVRTTYFAVQFPDPEDRAAFEAPSPNFLPPARQRFVRLELSAVYVPDLAAYEVPEGEPKIDRHLAVDVDAVRRGVAAGRP